MCELILSRSAAIKSTAIALLTSNLCCRTYTTSYKGTLRIESNGDASVSGAPCSPPSSISIHVPSHYIVYGRKMVNFQSKIGAAYTGRKAEWVPTTEQLDRSLLMARDPILFFDEVPLYESELDDNGASQLGVKVLSAPISHATTDSILACICRAHIADVDFNVTSQQGTVTKLRLEGRSRLSRDLHLRGVVRVEVAGAGDAGVLVCAAALLAARGLRAGAAV